jgi:hypothetical protein
MLNKEQNYVSDILDDIFHGCAWAAYVDQMREEQHWPPDMEATKRRAIRYYEEELAKKNHAREGALPSPRVSLQNPSSDACDERRPRSPEIVD